MYLGEASKITCALYVLNLSPGYTVESITRHVLLSRELVNVVLAMGCSFFSADVLKTIPEICMNLAGRPLGPPCKSCRSKCTPPYREAIYDRGDVYPSFRVVGLCPLVLLSNRIH